MLGWILLFFSAALALKFWHGRGTEKELRDLKLKSIQRRLAEKELEKDPAKDPNEPTNSE